MKNILLLIFLFLSMLFVACDDNDSKDTWEEYTEWREQNNAWIAEQEARTNADGSKYFERVQDPTNPLGYVLMHYFNDRSETAGNLQPMSTSRVNVRYHLSLFNGERVDSSDLQTKWGDGIYQTSLNENIISGWTVGVCEMRVGDTVEMLVPYTLGYGMSGSGASVPPYSNLRFNIRLVDIVNYETRP